MQISSTLALKSDLVRSLELIQKSCEENEEALASPSNSFWEQKNSGSYYTPSDACDFFWNQFFLLKDINSKEKAAAFLSRATFIEPSVGAGMFLFSLLKKIFSLGCSLDDAKNIQIHMYDINSNALSFVKERYNALKKQYGSHFGVWKFHHKDYLSANLPKLKDRYIVFVGNPPFIRNKPEAKWKNSFANFFEASYLYAEQAVDVAFIVPLSFNFSRDYAALRNRVLADKSTVFSVNFDNIPDCIFKSGKINSINTNKANSQRCSMVFAFKDGRARIYATELIKWPASERSRVFSSTPRYFNCSKILNFDQIPRPFSSDIAEYASTSAKSIRFSSLFCTSGCKLLNVATVARNYISIRETETNNCHSIAFDNEKAFFVGLAILSSDVFFEYWKTFGDGFHLTKADIYNFPISAELLDWAKEISPYTRKVWAKRLKYKKEKLNAGVVSVSYDLRGLFDFWSKDLAKSESTSTATRKHAVNDQFDAFMKELGYAGGKA